MAVIDLQIDKRFAYSGGRQFGKTGSYEQIDGTVTFAVVPSVDANKSIVDLHLAPTDQNGKVRFSSDFSIIKPVDPSRGSNGLLVELPNRGRRRVIDTLNRSGSEASASPHSGDGFLFERGLTVASIGWQWDVYQSAVLMGLTPPAADLSQEPNVGQTVVEIRPNKIATTWLLADRVHKPLKTNNISDPNATLYVKDFEDGIETVIPRENWRFAQETSDGIRPSEEHIYLEDGFEPGKCYQIVYETIDAPVAGSGLIALRDVTSFLKYESRQPLPDLGKFNHAIGYGVSQTGRMLRHFLYLGLNVDESGRKVFDGLLPHVAGGRVGAFNHRFAQPSNQSYPSFGHQFPFHDEDLIDPFTEKSDGLLKKLAVSDSRPKVIYTNSSSEYWRGDGSLVHTDPSGSIDVENASNFVRVYHFAGTQHGAGTIPQSIEPGAEDALPLFAPNVVDYSPLLRAAFINLQKWITNEEEPPDSKHPRIDDGTAVKRGEVLHVFDRLPDQVTPDRSKLWVIRAMDLGIQAENGIGIYPTRESEIYACLVSSVDSDGNELSGIRLPDITQPVATHSGWNMRHPKTGAPDQLVPMIGFSRWFAPTEIDRTDANDPRRSIEDRYIDRDTYIDLVTQDAKQLSDDKYILENDIDIVVKNAIARYDFAINQ